MTIYHIHNNFLGLSFWMKFEIVTICNIVTILHFNISIEIVVIGGVYLVIQLNIVVISITFNWFAYIRYIVCCREITTQ